MQILVVEDDPDLREALCEVLGDAGHHAVGVGTGAEAIDLLAKGCRGSFVLLDLSLPDMDCQSLIERIRQHHDCSAVVVMTGLPVASPIPGADGILVKPFDTDVLFGSLETHG